MPKWISGITINRSLDQLRLWPFGSIRDSLIPRFDFGSIFCITKILVFCWQLIQTSFHPGVLVTRTGEREIGFVPGRAGIYGKRRYRSLPEDMKPYSVVEKEGSKHMINVLEPRQYAYSAECIFLRRWYLNFTKLKQKSNQTFQMPSSWLYQLMDGHIDQRKAT